MTFVLVPGAGGQSWYWHRVVPLLDDDDVVAVELPAADESAGIGEYADAIVERAGDVGGAVTLVAQSMAGFSAPLVCDRLDVRRIVLVNAMIPLPGETAGEWWENTKQREAMVGEFDLMESFFHDVPDEVTKAAFEGPPPAQAARPFADAWPLPAWPDVPTGVVAGADDRFFPVEFQQSVARERLGLEIDVLPGGHLIALSRPEPLADYLRVGGPRRG